MFLQMLSMSMMRPVHEPSSLTAEETIRFIRSAANPQLAVKTAIRRMNSHAFTVLDEKITLTRNERIKMAFLGKAAVSLASGAIPILKDVTSDVFIACLPESVTKAKELVKAFNMNGNSIIVSGDHPIPTENSLNAGQQLMKFIDSVAEDQLLLMFISGGGSAMVEVPSEGISLKDLQSMNCALLTCGATIQEINALRKHVSAIKGGQLAARCHGHVEALLVSDVPRDDPSIIASGLTAPDPTTFQDCLAIIRKYRLDSNELFPHGILQHIKDGIGKQQLETPKHLSNVHNHVLLSPTTVQQQLQRKMESRGIQLYPRILDLDQPVEAIASEILSTIHAIRNDQAANQVVTIGHGEPQVVVRGNGKGGRCSELALRTLQLMIRNQVSIIDYFDEMWLIFLATDGKDGNTNAAGITLTKTLVEKVVNSIPEVDAIITKFLQNSDSFGFFEKFLPMTIITSTMGTSTTNIRDFQVGYFKKRA